MTTSIEDHISATRKEFQRIFSRGRRIQWIAENGGCCKDCGSHDNLQIDHIIPVTNFGNNDYGNLQVLCRPCNIKKGGLRGSTNNKVVFKERVCGLTAPALKFIYCNKEAQSSLATLFNIDTSGVIRMVRKGSRSLTQWHSAVLIGELMSVDPDTICISGTDKRKTA